jgi:glycosyltransferase involved in cell wall biosynthesis
LLRVLSHAATIISRFPLPYALEILGKFVSESQLIKASHLVTAVSPGLADSIDMFYPASRNKIRVSVAGAPASSGKSYWPFPLRDDRLRLVMVGRPVPYKGWDYVARALKNLETTRPDEAARLELTLIGNSVNLGGAFGRRINEAFGSLKSVSYFSMEWIPNKRVL